jgi:phage terminase large subunit
MEVELKVNKHFVEYVTNWECDEYLLVGAYGSSKSYETATKIILKLLQEKRKCLVVRDKYEQLRESCWDLIYEILDVMDLVTEEKTKEARLSGKVIASRSPLSFKFPNGSRIIFKGMDAPAKVKSINDVTIVWIEECSEVKYDGYKELKLRLRHPSMKIHYLLTTNPVDKQNWVFKHFFERVEIEQDEISDEEIDKRIIIQDEQDFYKKRSFINPNNGVYYHHSVPEDNAFLTVDYIKKLEELKSYDPDLYRVARLGRFGVNGRKVLPQFVIATDAKQFKQEVNSCKIKRNGFDFGFETSYNALIRVAINTKDSVLYIYDEWYRNKLTDSQTTIKLREWNKDVVNWRVKADCAQPSSIKYFHDEGFNFVKCHKIERLEQVRKIKRFRKIICSPKCKNAIRELQYLVYKEDSNGELIYDEFNIDPHTFSAIWYALDDITVADVKERKTNSKKGSI